MKRRLIKVSLVILVVVGIVLSLLVAMVCDSGPEISFGFLDGRTLTARIKEDPGTSRYRITQEVYSFEADFEDFLAEANAELSALGFIAVRGVGGRRVTPRRYSLPGTGSAGPIGVYFRDSQKLKARTPAKLPDYYSHIERFQFVSADGWVSVEVTRRRVRLWPPKYFLMRLQMMLQRNAGRSPVRR